MKSFVLGFLVFLCSAFLNVAQAGLTLISSPSDTVVFTGASITFTIKASSNRSIRYYWYKNGVMMGNKTKTLAISKANESHEATYTCLINDGRTKLNCPAFKLVVSDPAPPVNILRLSWTPPTTYVDGRPLPMTEIAGYRVYEMPAQDALLGRKLAEVREAKADIVDLPPGSHIFRVSTVATNGLESSLSDIFVWVAK